MATKHSVDAPAPLAQYVPPAQAGVACVAFVPQLATFSDGTQRMIVPLSDRVIGRVDVGKNGTRLLLVVEVSNG